MRHYSDVVLECRTCGRRAAVAVDGADFVCPCGDTEYRIVAVDNVAEALKADRERRRARDEGADR